MARPRGSAPKELTTENVYARMIPGKTYPAYVIAAKFSVPTREIRPHLDALIRAGRIEHSHALAKTLGFRRPGKNVPAPAPTVLDTSIAAPPAPPNLNDTLTGYGETILNRIALCMMVRR